MTGWIKLHRQLMESPFYGNPIAVSIWIHCLLRANHEPKSWFFGREKIEITPGEFVMGYREFSAEIGCGVATLKAWLDLFECDEMIERRRNAKGSTVKLKKWNEYQESRTLSESSRNDDGTLTEPNKNIKNVKNDKKYVSRPETETLYQSIEELCGKYDMQNNVDIKALDVLVERYIGKIHMKVELQHCFSWLLERKLKMLSAQRLGNWFKNAQIFQKREQNRNLEWQLAHKDPMVKERMKERGEKAVGAPPPFSIHPDIKSLLNPLPK